MISAWLAEAYRHHRRTVQQVNEVIEEATKEVEKEVDAVVTEVEHSFRDSLDTFFFWLVLAAMMTIIVPLVFLMWMSQPREHS